MKCQTCQRELPISWFYYKRRFRRRTQDWVHDYNHTCKSCLALKCGLADPRVQQVLFSPAEDYRAVYDEWCSRRANGEDVHVDHIIPLVSPEVCGLHLPINLRVIEAWVNISKGNQMTSSISESLG